MNRNRKQSADDGGIPRWFVTYSDVITLLMTFFILLLTFASSEPEGFDLMQQSLFGAGGSSGTIGTKIETMERDTFVERIKPTTSRLTTHGSEMPPMHSDVITESASKGLQALTENNDLVQFERFSFNISVHLYIDSNGEMTDVAKHQLQMVAQQMTKLPLELALTISSEKHLQAISRVAEYLTTKFKIPPGRIAVSLLTNGSVDPKNLHIQLRQTK